MKPINIKKIGNKIVVTLCNGHTVQSSVTPEGIGSQIIYQICESEGITAYDQSCLCNAARIRGYYTCLINGERIEIKEAYFTDVNKLADYIESIRIYIDRALIVHEEVFIKDSSCVN